MSQKIGQENFWTISSLYVLNCFKYFVIKGLELHQVFVAKHFNISILYTLKALLSKNCFSSFFLII